MNPHSALNYPIDLTEPALIGDQLAGGIDSHLASSSVMEVWLRIPDESPSDWSLAGSRSPGDIHFTLPLQILDGDLEMAGIRWDPDAEPFGGWHLRPFAGDPRPYESFIEAKTDEAVPQLLRDTEALTPGGDLPTGSDAMPGMWESSDVMGGATDMDSGQPASAMVTVFQARYEDLARQAVAIREGHQP